AGAERTLAPMPDTVTTKRRRNREILLALLFLAPSLVVFGVFVFYPLVKTFWLGTQQTDPFGGNAHYVGLHQYTNTIKSASFHNSIERTLLFALFTVLPGLILGMLLAVAANQKLKGITFFRTIFSSTVATSVAVASVIFLTLFNPNVGLVNYLLH